MGLGESKQQMTTRINAHCECSLHVGIGQLEVLVPDPTQGTVGVKQVLVLVLVTGLLLQVMEQADQAPQSDQQPGRTQGLLSEDTPWQPWVGWAQSLTLVTGGAGPQVAEQGCQGCQLAQQP